ncbi:MAG TPA: glycosyltransferase family 39 protein [Fimbriiglobus sp.]|nr:glycosyltransferase family 39 protein [Fimbriiglobus sp.]
MRIRGHIFTLNAARPGPVLAAAAAWLRGHRYFGGLAALAVAYLALAATFPPTDDELYYWCWSRDLQLSYFDHPPMTALMIRASTAVAGQSVFAVRLPACLSSVVVLGVIGWLMRPRRLLPGVALTPLFTFGAALITPDTPLLLFWSAYLAWLVIAHRRLDDGTIPLWMWFVGGALLGCGALGKYTTVLAVPAGCLSFLLAGRPWRAWVPGYLLHGCVSFLFVLPVLAFNVREDFAPLRFQWSHAMAAGHGLKPFAEFVGVQLLLFGTMPLVLFPWVVWNLRRLATDPRLRVCACLYALPLGFFLYKAVRGPLEANWALACYVGFWPVAAYWYEGVRTSRRWRWAVAGSFVLPAGCVLVLFVHMLIAPLPFVKPRHDRLSRYAARQEAFAELASVIRRYDEPLPVFGVTYQTTARLRVNGVAAEQLAGATRPSNFTLRPHTLAEVDRALVVNEGPLPAALAPGFDPPRLVATVPVTVRGQAQTYYQLLLYTRPKN